MCLSFVEFDFYGMVDRWDNNQHHETPPAAALSHLHTSELVQETLEFLHAFFRVLIFCVLVSLCTASAASAGMHRAHKKQQHTTAPYNNN